MKEEKTKVTKEKKKLTEAQVERRMEMKKTLQSMIVPLVLFAILAAVIIFVINYQNKVVEEPEIRTYASEESSGDVILENDDLLLTMDPATTQFTVKVKSTGKEWHSVAQGAESDALALGAEKDMLQSNMVIKYSVTTGLETTYDSNSYSVKNGIYEILQENDEIRVNYSMGDVEKTFIIPPVTTAAKFDAWLDLMDKSGKNLVAQYYKKYDINNLKKKDNKEELIANYPIIESEIIYVLRDGTKDNVKRQMEKAFEAAGYTFDDYTADKELDFAEKSSDKPIFNVSMILKLDGKDLVVTVPYDSMEYRSEFPIYTVTPLPYFGATGTDASGYMFVPEGGGALINMNNGKVAQSTYYANMYGWDMAIKRDAVVHNTRAYYNVFGMAEENDSFICIMEEGASYASIAADIAGRTNSYNYVNAVYSANSREQFDVGEIANTLVYVYTDSLPHEDIVQRYSFVDSGSYVDMAKDYGKYLQNKYGSYMALNDDTAAPVEVEIVGAVDKVEQVLGVPTSKPLPLTTFDEAKGMITELTEAGFDNMSVKLVGWANGGVQQKVLNKVKVINRLGGKNKLQSLTKAAKDLGVDLYLNGVTAYAYDSDLMDGFFSYRDAAKLISKERVELHHYSHITYAEREWASKFFLLHTDLAFDMAKNLEAAASKYGANVAFEDLGMDLSSDFYKKKLYTREAVRKLQEEEMKKIADSNEKLMINMGNVYGALYSDFVTEMDLKGSGYTILDAEVPFYQLALHGYVNYTGDPLNICGNEEEMLLNSAEYGAGLAFTVMDESSFSLQKTLYPEYYGSEYSKWKDRMIEIYNRYNSEMGHVFNQEMVNHEWINGDLACTTYADGTKVYVNYSYAAADTPDGAVSARDYMVVR